MRDLNVKILFVLLIACGLGLIYAKHNGLGVPLLPDQESMLWAVEARVEFEGKGKSARVDLDIPDKLGKFLRIDELFISRKYGTKIEDDDKDRRVEWSTRNTKGLQRLYYRIEFVEDRAAGEAIVKDTNIPSAPEKPEYEEPLSSAIQDILSDVRLESADIYSFVSQLLVHINNPGQNTNVEVIRKGFEPGSREWVEQCIYVLAGARITARMVQGISLEDDTNYANLLAWLEVHNGEEWEGFDPQTGNKGYPENFLRWTVGDTPLLKVKGGKNPHVTFSVSKHPYSVAFIAQERAQAKGSLLASFSLVNLPLGTQNVFNILLLLPLGVLVVVFMRVVVGIPTLGTFMPVLIALAFRETELFWGIVLFALIVAIGLSVRFFLERLNLLLVPRLSAVLVIVILLMLMLSLVSNHFGFDRGFSIALFPIVILAMVIERLSIIWEEAGALEAIKESLGSLLVAVMGYFVMNNDYLEHLVFYFPECLLIVLAFFIFMGRYTSYRLTELIRFKDLA